VNEMWNFRSKFQHGYVIIFINRNDSIKSRLSNLLYMLQNARSWSIDMFFRQDNYQVM